MVSPRVKLAFLLLLTGIIIAGYINSSNDTERPTLALLMIFIDTEKKRAIFHVLLFSICGFLLTPTNIPLPQIAWTLLFLIAAGVAIEVVQLLYGNSELTKAGVRDILLDLIVDTVAAVTGISLAKLIGWWMVEAV